MSKQLLEKAKRAILSDIQKQLPGTGNLEIKVEAHGGVEYFRQALQLPEVQSALKRKNITASIRVIDPLSQVKSYILENVKNASTGATLIFQILEQDADLHYDAVALLEVKSALAQKNITIEFQKVDRAGRQLPDIIIATYDDIASRSLD